MHTFKLTLFSAMLALLASSNCRAQVPTDSIVADFRDFISSSKKSIPTPIAATAASLTFDSRQGTHVKP